MTTGQQGIAVFEEDTCMSTATRMGEVLESSTDLQQILEEAATEASLQVRREDIRFHNVTPERVHIEIDVRNEGDTRSRPTWAQIMAAPLGAFVRWKPLTVAAVPSLSPGESFTIRTEARRVIRPALGSARDIPPRKLLTALGLGDDEGDDNQSRLTSAITDWLKTWMTFQANGRIPDAREMTDGTLPADPFELLFAPNPHWAGNLNVFIGRNEVERHMAQALRVYPGRNNLAMFIVGQRPDAYRFSLTGTGVDWAAALFDTTSSSCISLEPRTDARVPTEKWIPMEEQRLLLLSLRPPKCVAGEVQVHVEQRSTGKEAVVEFSLDPEAAGPGCYVV
jgi:hypothetical protein